MSRIVVTATWPHHGCEETGIDVSIITAAIWNGARTHARTHARCNACTTQPTCVRRGALTNLRALGNIFFRGVWSLTFGLHGHPDCRGCSRCRIPAFHDPHVLGHGTDVVRQQRYLPACLRFQAKLRNGHAHNKSTCQHKLRGELYQKGNHKNKRKTTAIYVYGH